MDVLADVLQWLHVEGTMYARAELKAPWGVKVPASEHLVFHVIDRGGGLLQREGEPPLALGAGDLVMISGGKGHALTDSLDTEPMGADAFFAQGHCAPDARGRLCSVLRFEGTGAPTTISCGHFAFEGGAQHPLFSLLPPLIHISSEDKDTAPWMDATLRFIAYETCQQHHGADTALARLIDLLFIQIIRCWLSSQPRGAAGWLGALRDESIGRAICLIHEQPEAPWTVASLGKEIGMSRSGFSARFQSLVGVPPLKYLTQWRMHQAGYLLRREQGVGLEQIARRVGYDSLVSFSRAFKRYYELSPGAWRRREGADVQVPME